MIVLDTHGWVFWMHGTSELPRRARRVVDAARAKGTLLISSISVWEVALLVRRGRLRLSLPLSEWLRLAEAVSGVEFVPVDNRIAQLSVDLPAPLHDDPADRIIVATALSQQATLVTADRRLTDYPGLRTLW